MRSSEQSPSSLPQPTSKLDRRSFLKLGGTAVVAVGAGDLLAACGGASSRAASAKPRYGGTLRAGITGGGSADTVNPFQVNTNPDFARNYQLFEPLVRYDHNALPELWLAEEVTPNRDFTVWTIRVRPDVTFHNGKPLTSADVAYTLRTAVAPKTLSYGAALIANIDTSRLKIVDRRTVDVAFKTPFASFKEVLPAYWFSVVPEGYNPATRHPIGTGPFVYKSFVPGQESVFVRNANYWRHGLPYLDSVVISDFADETSQVNALISGQIDVANALSAPSIAAVRSAGGQVAISNGSSFNTFIMNESVPPFTDVRVRQALRALVDRQAMINVVFQGHGQIGNDVFSFADPLYDHGLPQREQDLAKAKSLLRAAGKDGLSLELVVAPVGPGVIQMAQVLAQQARAAGVNISLRQVTPAEIYGPNFTKWPFTMNFWYYLNYFPMVIEATLPTASLPETHFSNSRYAALFMQAQKAASDGLRSEIAHEMQRIDYEDGGYIIPFFLPVIDGMAGAVHGTQTSRTGVDFANFDFSAAFKA